MKHEAVAILVLAVSACSTIREELPTTSSSSGPATATAPIPVVVVPVAIPVPQNPPATTPGAPSAPGSTPSPSSPQPGASSCSLGSSRESGCSRTNPSFLGEVEAAIDQLVRAEPALFNLGKTQGCGNCYEVVNPSRYVQRMAEMVRRQGLCSIYDGEELAVKNANSFSDQYDILTAQSFIRRQGGSYRVTCRPAAF
jgi:hypothetical protein